MLKILTNPHPLLRQRAKIVADPLDAKIQTLIPQMVELMKKNDGAGLAAPQVGQSVRLIVIGLKDNDLVLINPKISRKSFLKEWGEEGCLSVPHTFGEVKRCKKITVKYLDERGRQKKLIGQGLLARVIQHEVDHLNGILFIDKAKNLKKVSNP